MDTWVHCHGLLLDFSNHLYSHRSRMFVYRNLQNTYSDLPDTVSNNLYM